VSQTRVLIVDDSALIRQVLADLLCSQPNIEVIGFARDGAEAVRLTRDLRPDVVTMDIEMPRMSGLDALAAIMAVAPTPVIMVSPMTSQGAQLTLDALDRGAVDFVCKPRSGALLALIDVRDELVAKIRATRGAALGRKLRRAIPASVSGRPSDRIVLIAASMGGPKALACLFETLPKGLEAPLLVAQDMPVGFAEHLAKRLDRIGNLTCREARDGDRPTPGVALFAPGGRSMTLDASGYIEIHEEDSAENAVSAADRLFASAAKTYGSRCIGTILTGRGNAGADGALAIKQVGGVVFVESANTCTLPHMPQAAKDKGAVDAEYPIHEIGHAIAATLARRIARAS
jgi:two-component system, chemotaxis family, protein-glutamate methylesterase/glutaminase